MLIAYFLVRGDRTYAREAPTFRRGPPKGYIKALERRLHEVESVLAAVMSSDDSRAVGIVVDLRKDELAKEILDRVDAGPFVSIFILVREMG